MSGNDQYEGFAIDIIYEISKMLGFNYTFSVQSDNVYGSLDKKSGQWNGMLRKIIDNVSNLLLRMNAVELFLLLLNSKNYLT